MKEKKQKKNKKLTRHITGIIVLLMIIPFCTLAGLNPNFYSSGYQYFFVVILAIVFSYGIYEITNLVFFKNKKQLKQTIPILEFLFISIFLFWGIEFFRYFNPDFYLEDSSLLLNQSQNNLEENIFLFFIISLIIINLIYFLYQAIFSSDVRDHFLIAVVVNLLFAFFTSIYLLLAIFNWNFFFLFILTTAVVDSSAFFIGTKFGKHKLSPKNSPGKTIEGAIFGSYLGIIFAVAWFFILIYPQQLSQPIIKETNDFYQPIKILSLFLVITFLIIVEPLADITFSKIKRSYSRKDFSNLLPGHGGLLDRIDGHIFTIIFANIFLTIIFL